MKTLNLVIISILISVCSSLAGAELPYKAIAPMLKIADGSKKIGEKIFAPIYLKSKIANIDISKANFRITQKGQKDVILKYEFLKKIPIESLLFSDIRYLKEGYTVKVWIPLDVPTYEFSMIKNNYKKGTFDVRTAKDLLRSDTIEEARAEYQESLKKEAEELKKQEEPNKNEQNIQLTK